MHSKALFRFVARCSLAFTVLAFLTGSLPEEEPAARASLTPWQALLVTRAPHAHDHHGEAVVFAEAHAAPRRAVLPAAVARRAKERMQKQSAVLPVVDRPDILPRHQKILDEVLRLLPDHCIARLKNVYVRYDHPEQRGLAGATTVILSGNVGDNEFRALAVHEVLGHFHELGCLDGGTRSVASAFRDGETVIKIDDPSAEFYAISWIDETAQRPNARESDFVSGYAVADPFEDLAEAVVAYVLQRDAFEDLAKKNSAIAAKLHWMETYMPPSVRDVATGRFAWSGKTPWDMTRLAYEWHGQGSPVAVGQ